MNMTTSLAALFAVQAAAKRLLPTNMPYVELGYSHVLKMSVVFQGGFVAWVAFWTMYGRGFSAETLQGVGSVGAACIAVVLVEPLIDVAVLAGVKALLGLRGLAGKVLTMLRLHHAA